MKIHNLKHGVSVTALVLAGLIISQPAYAAEAAATAADGAASDSSQGEASAAIVVTGRRKAIQTADQRKKNAETVMESVLADEAGKLPDNSITEVLQHVSGVTIVRFASLGDPDHFSIEGSGVQVRGLSGVASRLNGREVFSANNGRSLLWGDVTPELMAGVDIYKSTSADMIEGGTGGTIDLRTKVPFDYKTGIHVSGSGEVSKGDLAKKNDTAASGLITGNWNTGIGRIGFLIDGAFNNLTSRSNFIRMEPYFKTHIGASDYFIPGGYDYGEQIFSHHRDGLYGALQWAPSNNFELTGIYFQTRSHGKSNEFASFVTSQTLAVDPAASEFDSSKGLLYSPNVFQRDTGTFLPNGSAISAGGNTGSAFTTAKTQEYAGSFKWTPGGGRLAVKGGYDHIVSNATNDSVSLFRSFAWPSSFGLDLRGKFPIVSLPASTNASLFLDPTKYTWQAAMPHNELDNGKSDAANLDAELSFDNSFLRSIKIGGRWSKRTERDLSNGYAWTALGAGWNGSPVVNFANTPDLVSPHTFDNFFHGGVTLPGVQLVQNTSLTDTLVNPAAYAAIFQQPPTSFCGPFDWGNSKFFNGTCPGTLASTTLGGSPGRTPGFVVPADQTDFSTATLAGYIMTRFGTTWGESSLTGNAGVRVVNVKNQSFGYYTQGTSTFVRNVTTYTLATTAAVVGGEAEFTKVLPAINVTYSPIDAVKIRAAYNITMDNAAFYNLRASGGLGVTTTANPANVGLPSGSTNLPGIFQNYTSTTGNPKLKPVMSNNFDLSFEWYPRNGTTMHLSAFYKRVTNVYVYDHTLQPVTVYFQNGTTEQAMAVASDIKNSTSPATIKGFELGGRTYFDKLPGLLRGLGFEGNYTYISSQNPGDLYRDINGVEHNDAPMAGLSTHNFNATVFWDHDPFSMRVSYSWRSQYLQSTNANGTNPTYSYFSAPNTSSSLQTALPTYGSAYGQFDVGMDVKVNSHFSLRVQGTNVLNATQKTLMGGYPDGKVYVRSWFQSDRRLTIGGSFNF